MPSKPTIPDVGFIGSGGTKRFDFLNAVNAALQDATDGAEQDLVRLRHGGSSGGARQYAAAIVNKPLLPIAAFTASAITPLPPAPPPRTGLITSGMENTTMSILENIILKLRPTSGQATDIATALALATSSAAEQDIAISRAKAARDDALLDAEPAVLRKAEQALADAREQGERVAAVLASLTARHAAAVKAEMVSNVADLKARTETAEAALSDWWQSERAKLVTTFTKGLALNEAAFNLRSSHDFARLDASQKHPETDLPYPAAPTVDATAWADDLGNALKWLHSGSREPLKDVQDIARISDPRPVQTFNLVTGGFE